MRTLSLVSGCPLLQATLKVGDTRVRRRCVEDGALNPRSLLSEPGPDKKYLQADHDQTFPC